ncbi:FtsW/RodA/SpoVE family cell cycle protein [Lacrimispora sp.]|jgi:rod shape determining protein RodA|uniref:FtsW/RodA/SpoVE family cell cycle protein n=1 Tax=Lacrimispora sp. TaxID=2719234 RepID=UPI0028A90CDC|nr:FtsW/RodA/SpoVE family cell cycle protein [Lacrimispora sp.]
MFSEINFKQYNYRLVLYMMILSVIGILVVASASNHDSSTVTKQIIGVMVGFALAIGLSIIDYHNITKLYVLVYAGCIILLGAVLVMGHTAGGATRWINLPGIGRIQPSEFVKIGLIIFFSWYWNKYQEKMNMPVMIGIAAGLAAIPIGLIFAEPNLSTSLVVTIIILCMVFSAGISYRWIFGVLAVIIPAGALFIFLLTKGLIPFIHDYQARRILAWIYPHAEQYAENLYQQKNSIMAISSGQLQGKGLFNTTIASVKDGNFLSAGETDFIFAIIGEEMGFRGSVIIILILALVVFECLYMASRAKDLSGRLICTGMAALIGFQAFANIAVATQIFPNTGLPLPFISSGVSSLISIFIGMGLVLNVGLQRKIGN